MDASGTPKCYQLKRGDIGLSDWRTFEGEVNQLVEIDPNHAALPSGAPRHQSFFVTNGVISDPVIHAITQRNVTWEKRDYGPLVWVQKDELVTRFRDAHGRYFPTQPNDFKTFLELYSADGIAPLDKESFANFIETILKIVDTDLTQLDVLRAAASAVLFTTYALNNHTASENHWAVFEGWGITAAAILALAAKSNSPDSVWSYSFDLCFQQARGALEAQTQECVNRAGIYVQGCRSAMDTSIRRD